MELAVFGGCMEATDAERASQKLLWCRGPETAIHLWLISQAQRVKLGEPETLPAVRGRNPDSNRGAIIWIDGRKDAWTASADIAVSSALPVPESTT